MSKGRLPLPDVGHHLVIIVGDVDTVGLPRR